MDKATNPELRVVLKTAIEGKHLKLKDANFLVVYSAKNHIKIYVKSLPI